jgi:hypothetical protein
LNILDGSAIFALPGTLRLHLELVKVLNTN